MTKGNRTSSEPSLPAAAGYIRKNVNFHKGHKTVSSPLPAGPAPSSLPVIPIVMGDTIEHIFPYGSHVTVTLRDQSVVEGEVMAYDYESKFIVVCTNPAKEGEKQGLVNKMLINLENVKDMDMRDGIKGPDYKPPEISLDKLKNRKDRARVERQDIVTALEAGISESGFRLYTYLKKPLSVNVHMQEKTIVVNDVVVVSPPYQRENVSFGPNCNPNQKTFEFVMNLVDRFWGQEGVQAVGDEVSKITPAKSPSVPTSNGQLHESKGPGGGGSHSGPNGPNGGTTGKKNLKNVPPN